MSSASPILWRHLSICVVQNDRDKYTSPFKTMLDSSCRLFARYCSLHTVSYVPLVLNALRLKYYLISGDEEREGDGEIFTDIWSQDIILETSDEILDDLSASMGVWVFYDCIFASTDTCYSVTMKLLYYNDALNQAVQVLGPLREFFETILTSFGPDNKVDGIVPALKKARDCTVYGAAADYVSLDELAAGLKWLLLMQFPCSVLP